MRGTIAASLPGDNIWLKVHKVCPQAMHQCADRSSSNVQDARRKMTPAKRPAMEPQLQRYLRDCAVLVPPGRLGADDGAPSRPTGPRGFVSCTPVHLHHGGWTVLHKNTRVGTSGEAKTQACSVLRAHHRLRGYSHAD